MHGLVDDSSKPLSSHYRATTPRIDDYRHCSNSLDAIYLQSALWPKAKAHYSKNLTLLFFAGFWQFEKYSLETTHTNPGAHLVVPVHVFPPHWSYN